MSHLTLYRKYENNESSFEKSKKIRKNILLNHVLMYSILLWNCHVLIKSKFEWMQWKTNLKNFYWKTSIIIEYSKKLTTKTSIKSSSMRVRIFSINLNTSTITLFLMILIFLILTIFYTITTITSNRFSFSTSSKYRTLMMFWTSTNLK